MKTGVGLSTFAPTTTGRDSQAGVEVYSPVMTEYDVWPAPLSGSSSSTCSMRGIGMNSPSPPSTVCTLLAACGRNGDSSVLQSLTHCAATWRTVPRRSRCESSFIL